MDRSELSGIAHAHHPVAAPVSTANVRTLVDRLVLPTGGRAVDLGCGHRMWLTELLAAHPTVTGVGLDLDLPADVATAARDRGVGDRVRWEQGDAAGWAAGAFDVVLCVGATHAFGGLDGTLTAVRRHLRPGGQVLLGDGIWEGPPSAAAQAELGDWPGGLTDLGVEPVSCLVVEDSLVGTASGLAAGASVLGVPLVQRLQPQPGLTLRLSLEGLTVADLDGLLGADVPAA